MATNKIPLPGSQRSHEWLRVALVECRRCHQVIERTSLIQRDCVDCLRVIKRAKSREAVRRSRRAKPA